MTGEAGDGSITYTWTEIATDTYKLYYHTSTLNKTTSGVTTTDQVSSPLTISGLTNGVPIFARLVHYSTSEESDLSVEVSATPKASQSKTVVFLLGA